MTFLKVKNINVFYGEAQALWDVSLELKKGEILSVIGSNAAGKTTLLKAISNIVKPRTGEIVFEGQKLNETPTQKIVDMGIVHIPQEGEIFPNMDVKENLEMGAFPPSSWEKRKSKMEDIFSRFPRLEERKNQKAETLSGGERQMLLIGRGLMSDPEIVMFDEPSHGLMPKLVTETFRLIEEINEEGKTVLLVEQNVNKALEISERAYVLEDGEIALEGKAQDLQGNDEIRKKYLGI